MTAQRSKLHHVVPQFYLRRFAQYSTGMSPDQAKVRLFDQDAQVTIGPLAVRNVAAETNFHTVYVDGEPRDEFETLVSEMESNYAHGFQLLDSHWPPTDEARALVSMFVAFQFVRTQAWRKIRLGTTEAMMKQMSSMIAGVAKRGDESIRKWMRSTMSEDLADDDFEEILDDLVKAEYSLIVDPQEHIEEMLHHLDDTRLAVMLSSRSWVLVQSTGHPHEFITSDQPIGLYGPPYPGALGVGLGNAGGVTLPLDRQRLLLMTWEPEDEGKRRLANGSAVERLNGLTRENARFVIGHPMTRESVLRGSR